MSNSFQYWKANLSTVHSVNLTQFFTFEMSTNNYRRLTTFIECFFSNFLNLYKQIQREIIKMYHLQVKIQGPVNDFNDMDEDVS